MESNKQPQNYVHLSKQEAIREAKNIPKGLTVPDEASLRCQILNFLVCNLQMGLLKRGETIAKYSSILGIEEDRPK